MAAGMQDVSAQLSALAQRIEELQGGVLRVPHGRGCGHYTEDRVAQHARDHGASPPQLPIKTREGLAALAEFIATLIFVYFGAGAAAAGALSGAGAAAHLMQAMSFGLGFTCLAYAFAPLSGAHLNPVVTAALAGAGRMRPLLAVLYAAAQLCGALVGALLLVGTMPDRCSSAEGNITRVCITGKDRVELAANQLMQGVTTGQGVLAEIIGTFFVVLVVLRTTADAEGSKHGGLLAPLSIGLSLFAAHSALIPITGCALNPARALAVSVVTGVWDDHWIFWVGPPVGAFFAFLFYWAGFKTAEPQPPPAKGPAQLPAQPVVGGGELFPRHAAYTHPVHSVSPPSRAPSAYGNPPAEQPQSQVYTQRAHQDPDAPATGPAMARYGDQWLPCTVAQRDGDGTVLVVWQDGQHSRLNEVDVRM
eukprot:TRINITY_DN47499_c0_g1_i1.p1 TRINITY_DN47499_c0_g1~~TRINITY_DN47499_c0_g1_i1.p1  ORF type:complete len:420 (+),score=111.29 TRINITY_DN47499_c0_g1_i1:74-1333(+)